MTVSRSSRKKNSRRKNKPFRRKLFFLSLSIIIFSVFLWQAIRLVRVTVWDGRSTINVIVDAGDIYLLSFSPEEEKMLVASVSSNIDVEVTYGFGFYPFRAVYDLGEMDKKGGEVLMSTAQELFAVPIDGWIKIASEKEKLEIRDERLAKEKVLKLLRGSISNTNLTVLDRWRLWWQIRQMRFDKLKFLNLEEIGVFTDKNTDFAKLDDLLPPFLAEKNIQEESLKIEVLNSTGQAGLGNRVGRLINNLGGEVMNLGNQDEKLNHCVIKVKADDKGKFTTRRLEKIFSCSVEETANSDSRGDLVLIIGDDYWQKLNGSKN